MTLPNDIILRLRPPKGDSDDDTIRRLRAALKRLLRSYRLRCVSARLIDQATAAGLDLRRASEIREDKS